MKRMIVVMAVLAVVLAALAPEVSAQSSRRRQSHRQDSFAYALQSAHDTLLTPIRMMERNRCYDGRGIGCMYRQPRGYRIPQFGHRGYNDYDRPYYSDRFSSYGNRTYSVTVRDRNVDPAKCAGKTLKEFQKRRVPISAEQVLALCGGVSQARSEQAQPEPDTDSEPEPEPAAEAVPTPAKDEPAQTSPCDAAQRGEVLITETAVCNKSGSDIVVYVNREPKAVVPNGHGTLRSHLPEGKIQYELVAG